LRLWDLVLLLGLLSWGLRLLLAWMLRLLLDWMLRLGLWRWMLLRRGGLGRSAILRRRGRKGFLPALRPREERANQEYGQRNQNSANKRGSVAGLHDISSITLILRWGHSLQEKMA
jgi:hypothetical protein